MANTNDPMLKISFDFAERLVRQLREAAQETGRESLLKDAESLQSQIGAQFNETPPRH